MTQISIVMPNCFPFKIAKQIHTIGLLDHDVSEEHRQPQPQLLHLLQVVLSMAENLGTHKLGHLLQNQQ